MLSVFASGLFLFLLCGASAQTSPASSPASDLKPASTESEPVARVGHDGVSAPIVLVAPSPEFSAEARKDKISGNVLIYLQVGKDGMPGHVRVIRGVGYGLDEKAVEAVKAYRFKPAMKDGVPVLVEMNVQVNFKVFDHKQP